MSELLKGNFSVKRKIKNDEAEQAAEFKKRHLSL